MTLLPGADTVSGVDVYTIISSANGFTGFLPPVTEDGAGSTPVFTVTENPTTVTATAGQSVTDLAVTA